MIWFTSDTHFGHARIVELSNRPFRDVGEMNEALVDNWNSVVSSNDTVYHLGDAVMGNFEENIKIVGRLKGVKILVPGNHDRVSSVESSSRRARFYPQYLKFFDDIEREYVEYDFDGVNFAICHYPYYGDSQDIDRHKNMRPVDNGLPLIHGHVHEKWRTNGRMFNVGVDVNDFRPVSVSTVVEWARSLDV